MTIFLRSLPFSFSSLPPSLSRSLEPIYLRVCLFLEYRPLFRRCVSRNQVEGRRTEERSKESISSPVSGNLFIRFRVGKQILLRSLKVVGEPWKCEFWLTRRILPFSGNSRCIIIVEDGRKPTIAARQSQ